VLIPIKKIQKNLSIFLKKKLYFRVLVRVLSELLCIIVGVERKNYLHKKILTFYKGEKENE
jgi:hypothetical protein